MSALGKSPWSRAKAALEAPDVTSVTAWADKFRYLSFGHKWRTSNTPYLAAIMDALSDPTVREVNLCFGSQCGKTESLFNFVGYIAHVMPAMILYMSSTKDLARETGRTRIDQMVMATPALATVFGVERGRSTKVGTLALGLKRFLGGGVKVASSQSPSDVLAHPIPYILCDEVDHYGGDRDVVIQLAKARASSFPWFKLVCASTPYGQDSAILQRVEASGDARFLVPCPHCGEAYEWVWQQIKCEAGGRPVHLCPRCSGTLREGGPAPLRLLTSGYWSSNDGPCRGYRLSSLYSPFLGLDELWREYAQARRSVSSLLMSAFVRDRLAMEYVAGEWAFDTSTFKSGGENPVGASRLPADAVRTCGVDVQFDRFEVTTLDIARTGEQWWLYDHVVLRGDTANPNAWDTLRGYLLTARPSMIFIDAGDGKRMHHVLKFVEAHHTRIPIVACKGAHPWRKKDGHVAAVTKGNAYSAPFVRLAAGYYKRRVQEGYSAGHYHGLERGALDLETPDPWHRHYVMQLFSEREEPTRWGGSQWIKTGTSNEGLDCSAYALAAFDYVNATKGRLKKIKD